jgi:hypothetical protein
VRFDGNDYSVQPSVIGRRIEVIADLARTLAPVLPHLLGRPDSQAHSHC